MRSGAPHHVTTTDPNPYAAPHSAQRRNYRRSRALALLLDKGLKRWQAAPTFYRVLWRIGLDVPPPHFATRRSVIGVSLLQNSLPVTIFAALLTWTTSVPPVALAAIVPTVLALGAGEALWRRRRTTSRLRLPDWFSIPDGPPRGERGE